MGKLVQALRRRFLYGTNTILIAESDQMLWRLECRALSPQYQIVQTSSPEDAVRIAAKHKMELPGKSTRQVRHYQDALKSPGRIQRHATS